MISVRKKVLFLIPTLEGGGAERFFSLLLQYLDRGRFEPHLALLQARGQYMQDIPDDVVVHVLGVSRARHSLCRIIHLIWKVRPTAVLSTLPQMNMALAVSRPFLPRGTRLLLSEAAFTSAILKTEISSPKLWKWLYRRFYRRADKIVCLSDSMIEDMASQFNVPREKLVRIYYPVDVKRVRELAETGGNPYCGPGPHLVAAGRLCYQKGFDLLLEAMPAVRQHFPHARLTILGDGPLHAELIEQARKLGLTDVVAFVGFQQNPWRYFRHADLFVLSSRYEGLPNVLLEALAVGVRIVATDCPSALREVQAHCKEMVLVPAEDSKAMASAMIEVCMRSYAEPPQEYLAHFDLQRIVEEYSSLLMG